MSKPGVIRTGPEGGRICSGTSADPVTRAMARAARLAVLRADMALRWETGEKLTAQWYLDRYSDLGEDTIVALVYEEFCLREEDDEHPVASEYLARYPGVSGSLQRVLEIHDLVGSGTPVTVSPSSLGDGVAASAAVLPDAGQTIGGFSLVEELGRGAFARVFLARERQLADRPVALKVSRRGSREPQTLARLQHTHIVPVYSHRIDTATGLHLLCMPYFGRVTLARVLADAEVQSATSGAAVARRSRPARARRRPVVSALDSPRGPREENVLPGDRLVGRAAGRGTSARPRPRRSPPRYQAVKRPGDSRRHAHAARFQPGARALFQGRFVEWRADPGRNHRLHAA